MEKNKTILIIDDDRDIRNLVRQYLKKTGYEVLEAVNGEEGLNLALDRLPDLILLDIEMPGKNGFKVLQSIRNTPGITTIPVIMLTVKKDINSVKRALSKANDYLIKPLKSPDLLLERVAKLIY